MPLLLYADDVVLLARSAEELQAMLDILFNYARTWRFDINLKKSGVVSVAGLRLRGDVEQHDVSVVGMFVNMFLFFSTMIIFLFWGRCTF